METLLLTMLEQRQAAGQTITAIARGAGITQPTLYRFVTRQQNLNLENAEKLVDYFNLELTPRKRKQSKPE
jgi:DNA-binding phage protein